MLKLPLTVDLVLYLKADGVTALVLDEETNSFVTTYERPEILIETANHLPFHETEMWFLDTLLENVDERHLKDMFVMID